MIISITPAVLAIICVVAVAVFLPSLFVWLLGIAACAVVVFIMYGFGIALWISVPVILTMLVLAGFINLPHPRKPEALEPPLDDHLRTSRDRSSEDYPRHFAQQQRLNRFL